MEQLQILLERTANQHAHLCPRQVLGVRMGMLAGKVLGLDLPQTDKRLFTFAESDGCGTGGIAVATGCGIERRTLRMMDFGKLAATFVDTQTGRAIRIIPHPESRIRSASYAPEAEDTWHTQLEGYQVMPDDQLLVVTAVCLTVDLEKIISQPGLCVVCERCGEEISNGREVDHFGHTLCRSCAGERYYADQPGSPGDVYLFSLSQSSGN